MSRFLIFCFWFLVAAAASAQDARHIVAESQNRSRAKSQRYEGTLEMIGPSNKASTKRWTYQRIGSSGESKAILRFTAPPELKGLALLIVNHPDRSSDQWMWTPAIERERRIAVQDRSTRFFGTDFSFEDLEERDVNQFDYKMLGEEAIDGAPCWKLESKPKESKSSQYSSLLIWVRKDSYVTGQIENYSNLALIRRIRLSNIEKVDNIWTPRTVEVFDVGRNSRTVLRIDKLQYNAPMKDEDFTIEALGRGSLSTTEPYR
jgi:outer membrane lipoprotein-sorting protein